MILLKCPVRSPKVKPDAVLVLGDTNSCLAAYMAKHLHIPVSFGGRERNYHFNVPEEINRRIIDHIADFNLVYTNMPGDT